MENGIKILISLLLFLFIFTSSTYANRTVKVKRIDLLRDAVSKMVKVPGLTEKMAWEKGGTAIDEFIEYLSVYEEKVYYSYSDRGLRSVLGKVLYEDMEGELFSLVVKANGKNVLKYFIGEEPDLKAIISEIISTPELSAKMEWGKQGLSTDEIMAEVIKHYPEVNTLYVQASHNKTDRGLRIALGKVLYEDMEGELFSLVVMANGKDVHKYFIGEEPDLKAIISEIISTPELSAKMEWGKQGLSTDEIMAEVIKHYLEVNTLYVQASHNKTDRGLRSVLGKVLYEDMRGELFSLVVMANGKDVHKYFIGEEPDLKAIISEIISTPELSAKMEWGKQGLSTDEITAEVIKHYPEVNTLYVQASHNKTDRGLRSVLGKVLYEDMRGELFSLVVMANGKDVHKYFIGEEPDLKAIISEIISTPELSAKMEWGKQGLSTDEIMAEVIKHYPEVNTLYVQASHNKTDRGLRSVLGKVLYEDMEGELFSLVVKANGKNVLKYFIGEEPDLKAIISEIISTPELSAKMEWGKQGLSIDEIMAEVIKHYPEVNTLYVQASHNKTDHGLRIALGKVMSGMNGVVSQRDRMMGYIRYFWKK